MLGVAALIVVMSVMNGFRAELFDKIVGLNGHAVVQGYGGQLPDWRDIVRAGAAHAGRDRRAAADRAAADGELRGPGRGRARPRHAARRHPRATETLQGKVLAGSLEALRPGSGNVAIGARLAEALGANVGGQISLISPEGRTTPFGTVPRIVSYNVAAIFEVGVYDYDKAFVIMPIEDAQTLLMMGDAVGMVEVQTVDADRVGEILAPLARAASAAAAVVADWRSMNSSLFEALQVERVAMFVILSIIILVAVFNILSSLIMLVRAKTRDIAILRTMGATRRGLMKVFMTVGVTIGALGILAGLGPGRVFALLPPAGRQFLPVPHRPESVGSLDPLPHRAAGQDRSVRGARHRRHGAGARASSPPSIRRGRRRAPIRCRCCAMNEVARTGLAGLKRSFGRAASTIDVLRGVDLEVRKGEIVALLGPSGSGKSTLLQAVGLLEGGFEGSIRIAGEEVAALERRRPHPRPPRHARLRLPVPPSAARFHRARECRHPPADPRRDPRGSATSGRESLLGALGLAERAHPPARASSRAASSSASPSPARSPTGPALVLADEPTGNLDEATADIVFAEFLRLVRDEGSAALVATHNERIAAKMDRVLRLARGRAGIAILHMLDAGAGATEVPLARLCCSRGSSFRRRLRLDAEEGSAATARARQQLAAERSETHPQGLRLGGHLRPAQGARLRRGRRESATPIPRNLDPIAARLGGPDGAAAGQEPRRGSQRHRLHRPLHARAAAGRGECVRRRAPPHRRRRICRAGGARRQRPRLPDGWRRADHLPPRDLRADRQQMPKIVAGAAAERAAGRAAASGDRRAGRADPPGPAGEPPRPARRTAPGRGPPPARAMARPSFNCRYARTSTEKMVCASPLLAARDREMASLGTR